MCLFFIFALAQVSLRADEGSAFQGNWTLEMPGGAAGWLTLSIEEGKPSGELWTVGGGRTLSDVAIKDGRLFFTRKIKIGKPEFVGGPPTGVRVACRYSAEVKGDAMTLTMHRPVEDRIEQVVIQGKRLPPLPPRPDLSKVKFGKPIELFNAEI